MEKGGQLKIISEDQIVDTYLASQNILQNVGVTIPEQIVLKELKAAGCLVQNTRVRIPPHIIEEAVRSAPGRFTLYGRRPNYKVELEGRRVCFQPMIGRLNTLDSKTKGKRRTNLEDVAKMVKVCDALPHYHLLHSGAIMPHIEGIPDEIAHVLGYYTSVKNSSKVIKGTCRGGQKAIDCLSMASIVAGSEEELKKNPGIYTTYNVISPLEHGREMLEGLREYVAYGQPVDITAEPQMGATSPVTLAGTLIQQTAELLSGVVITQVLRQGTPVFIGTCGAALDMRHGTISLGGIEAALLNTAHAQIAQYLQIPSRGTGSNTESKILDFQAGYEKAITLLLPALAGINMIFYPGTLDHAETISIESLVMDHDVCSMVVRALQGISFTEKTTALEIIAKVGPGGHYLKERHTIDFMQSELLTPKIADRRRREDWETAGGKDMAQAAEQEVEKILSEHQVLPLEAKADEELLRVIEKTKKRLSSAG
ncbi:MAG: trimethylamine methyltransferase family protein [Spirochaetaceae bacterium]|nr:MAG: trimethylamine methyltransferase family protein [Spirochaetaceae bacterium]